MTRPCQPVPAPRRPTETERREDYLAAAAAEIPECGTCGLRADRWDSTDPLWAEGAEQCPGCLRADLEEMERAK